MSRSLLLQLSDSAFPAGAFAHSYGFEALAQAGLLPDEAALTLRLTELLWHTALGALPFLNDAHGGAVDEADAASDVFLSNHVANRASRAQGQAFLLATRALFGERSLRLGHAAPAMGAVLSAAGLSREEARHLVLFGTLRGALSAAVRLGVLGPLRAQAVLLGQHAALEAALAHTANLTGAQAAGVAPRLELAQASHERLYSRLFQS